MFPLNDFNFVACALATFSAAVGYNVSRRRGRNPSHGHAEDERVVRREGRFRFFQFHRRNSTASARSASLAPTESDGTEPPASHCGTPVHVEPESFSDEVEDGTLKRKRSPSPEAAQPTMPPAKRRRTPPVEETEVCEGEEAVMKTEETTPELVISDRIPGGSVALASSDANTPGSDCIMATSRNATADVLMPALVEESAPSNSIPASPEAAVVTRSPIPTTSQLSPWHAANPVVPAKPSSVFQAFSGRPSAFASSSSTSSCKAPAWSAQGSSSSSVLSETPASSSGTHPLAALEHSLSTHKTVTGEENEGVETELKGAKVFIKRGDRDFCEGILGNVKLLKHNQTGDERILFRREPVWKVTMSVRLRPTVRCSFDEAQGALRVTLKELVEETQQEQWVVYVLKRGKAGRSEFAEFAKAVAGSARLQERTHA